MRVAVPREVKNNEFRVAITPSGVTELTRAGHEVLIEHDAGVGSSIPDAEYEAAGARIVATADDAWAAGEMVLKVKEPVPEEYHRMRAGQTLFTYLHLAASLETTKALLDAKVTAIAYETVQTANRALPLLAPMSEVAGRLAPLVGATQLFAPNGGRGVLLSGVPGTHSSRVAILGGGVSGLNAATIALGMGADVTLLDVNVDRLRQLDQIFGPRLKTAVSNAHEIERAVLAADLVIGAVLIPGARAPKLVTNDLVRRMRPGSVLVDIAIDQGGCFEDSHPTTHADPSYRVHDALFYCVANMPGAVPHTSTYALTNVTLPYVVALANKGWRQALADDEALRRGLNTIDGAVTNPEVAHAHEMTPTATETVLAA